MMWQAYLHRVRFETFLQVPFIKTRWIVFLKAMLRLTGWIYYLLFFYWYFSFICPFPHWQFIFLWLGERSEKETVTLIEKYEQYWAAAAGEASLKIGLRGCSFSLLPASLTFTDAKLTVGLPYLAVIAAVGLETKRTCFSGVFSLRMCSICDY